MDSTKAALIPRDGTGLVAGVAVRIPGHQSLRNPRNDFTNGDRAKRGKESSLFPISFDPKGENNFLERGVADETGAQRILHRGSTRSFEFLEKYVEFAKLARLAHEDLKISAKLLSGIRFKFPIESKHGSQATQGDPELVQHFRIGRWRFEIVDALPDLGPLIVGDG